MGQPRLKWGEVQKYLTDLGYTIREQGGDKIIIALHDGRKNAIKTNRNRGPYLQSQRQH